MNKTPLYIAPLETPNIPYSQLYYWDLAVESFDLGKYYDALTHLIHYINKDILGKGKITKDCTIVHPHGSGIIKIAIKNDEIHITAPFLKTTRAHKKALYRKISEINFHPLTLARIKLKDDLMWFEYKTSIDRVQPNKIYDVLREICVFVDDFDDAFIKKYNAQFYQKPQIEHFKLDHDIQIYNDVQKYVANALEVIEQFEKQRETGFVWDVLVTTCFKIADMLGIHGTLRTDIEDQVIFLRHNDKIAIEDRIAQSKQFFINLSKLSFDELAKNFYRCDYFISTKFRSSLPIIQQYLKAFETRKNEELQSGNNIAVFFTLYYAFLSLLYDYNVSKEHFVIIANTMEQISNVDFHTGATLLIDLFNKFQSGDFELPSSSINGFFAKLFTNR